MTKRALFNWTVWISFWSAIYTFLYTLSPLNEYGVVYATFVALPIYFLSGAKKEEYLNFSVSFVTGVGWGIVYIFCITYLIGLGMGLALSQGLVIFVVTVICVGFHFIVTPNTLFNKVPAMFGGIAVTFSTGGTKIIPLMITLVLGATLAYLCNYGLNFLSEEGKWQLPSNGKAKTE